MTAQSRARIMVFLDGPFWRGSSYMNAPKSTTYQVQAYNLSHASENKIHDDAVAQKLGFAGGLVPGVEVYAYACHPAVERWGHAWLERGRMECRFLKPVYDGRIAVVTARDANAGLDLMVQSEACCAQPGMRRWGTARPSRRRSIPTGSAPRRKIVRRPTSRASPRATGWARSRCR